jgi:hypothetical protein
MANGMETELRIPFSSAREAEIVYNSLRVEVEPARSKVGFTDIQRLPTTPFSLVLRKEYFDCPQRDSYI